MRVLVKKSDFFTRLVSREYGRQENRIRTGNAHVIHITQQSIPGEGKGVFTSTVSIIKKGDGVSYARIRSCSLFQ